MSDRLDRLNDGATGSDGTSDVIKSLDDALKAVDDSKLAPAPSSVKPVIDRLGPVADRTVSGSAYGGSYGGSYGGVGGSYGGVGGSAGAGPGAYGGGAFEGGAFDESAWQELRAPKVPVRKSKFSFKQWFAGLRGKGKRGAAVTARDASAPGFNDADVDIGSPDFKMKFDFETVCKDVPENRPLRRRRERRTGLVGGLMFSVFILCVSLVLASVMWMATIDVLGFASDDELVNVQVPPDFTMEGITDMLYEAGLIRYKALFNLYANYSSAEEKISPGSYVLNKSFDYRALVQGMTARAGVRVETTVTIPEGFTLAQIFTLLESEEVCTAAELWDAATYHDFSFYFLSKETLGNRLRLEGFLFPDTYNFYKGSTAVQAIGRMLREFDRKFTEQFIERADYLGYTVREIVIIASMIEREAGDDEERPRIAAVIYNRLNSPNFPNLEIDATIRYIIAGTSTPFSTQLDNEFNTYMYPGLPPGPIANPGIMSIRAALYPASTNEFYYALNKQGTHNFFTNFNDHINFVNSDQYGG